MKNYLKIIPVLAAVISLFSIQTALAAGGTSHIYNIVFTPQTTSAPADGNSSITIQAHAYSYICSQPDSYGGYDEYQNAGDCAAAGFGTGTYENRQVTFYLAPNRKGIIVNSDDSWSYTTNSSGNATIVVKAVSAGSVTLSGYNEASLTNMRGQTTVNFTAVPPPPTPTPTPTPSKMTTTTKTTTPSPTPSPAATTPSGSAATTSSASPKPAVVTPQPAKTDQMTLVKAMTGKSGLAVGGIVLLGLLLFLLSKFKLIKLPFTK